MGQREKHERLRKYVDITCGVRKKWVDGTGGATYIDLFCGAGRAVVRETGEVIDGSPLVAFKTARDGKVPFSQIYIADESEESGRIAQQRLTNAGASSRHRRAGEFWDKIRNVSGQSELL